MPAEVPGAWSRLRGLLPEGLELPQAAWSARHRAILWVLAGHVALLPVLGWYRGWGPAFTLGEGLPVAGLAAAAAWPRLGWRLRSCLAALGLLASSTILVQFSGGYIEAHFHYFVVVAVVALYQDYAPFILAIAYVALGHGVVGALAPQWVYNHADAVARPWKWALVDAVALLAESVALLGFWASDEQARARSDLVLDSAGEGVLGLDPGGRVTFANRAAERILRQPVGRLIGGDVRALVPGVAAALDGASGSGPAADAGLPIEWSLTPAVQGGRRLGSVLVVRDVAARRQLERQLEARTQQQACLARLGQAALDGRDLDGLLAEAVREAVTTLSAHLGAVLEVAPGGTHLVLRSGVGWGAGVAGVRFPRRPGAPSDPLGGELAPLLARHGVAASASAAIPGADGPWGILVVHARSPRAFPPDDTSFLQAVANLLASAIERERTAAELRQHRTNLAEMVERRTAQLTEANRELEAFSYTVSRDLRSPLRAIDGFSRILLARHGDDLPPESRALLGRLSDGAVHMGSLIESVLALSRLSRVEPASTPLDLSALAQQVLRELEAKAPHRRVAWSVEPGLQAHGDPGLVRMALENLLANAWKFTGRTATPTIRVGRVGGAVPATFFVEDNGAGFEMANARELFQPFHRLHTPEEFEGTGIGLATVSRIVRRHGGRVWAESAPGRGARFFFTLAPAPPTAGPPVGEAIAVAVAT
ncbi:MAG: GAF domain-containing protein [Halobacteriales archaeon]|nr:GAF domain-containing protein [Halobacteriales archaeon]